MVVQSAASGLCASSCSFAHCCSSLWPSLSPSSQRSSSSLPLDVLRFTFSAIRVSVAAS